MTERRLIAVAVAFGVFCRAHQYAVDPSLWHDEAFVALNALHTPVTGLLGRLDWHERAVVIEGEQDIGVGEPGKKGAPLVGKNRLHAKSRCPPNP